MIINIFGKNLMNRNGRSKSCGLDTQLRIGDFVQSCKYGNGTIQALGPDGNVIVRFKEHNKTQAIYPSFLKKVVA